ncbi:nicotinamide-nucleotide amidase [Tessaracoccus bendigoensis DSM 12906]|uniref:Nicotinamide-nucleotide amidase n=1 Tax=Tessaracoccus bendigoensis DSM 12906 TaxID=1123357 RepID=A0A1M6AEE8_9ACTN|nr:CinA family protein [Tessaracoccus bendigoensis]SHI34926.1 nicotinamide-nucleotide amidase [Tessaracoccus bendigoensis DSM 12906]
MTLAEELIRKMAGRSLTLSTCESLTGGGIGAALTSVPGASAVFRGALVTYARDLKASLAGVDEELIAHEGVVNELTALQMALGAQTACGSDWAVSTTGVAGPTETDGAKVGTVWFAVVGPRIGTFEGAKYTELKEFQGDREQIRHAAIDHSFEMLLRVL